VHLGFFGLAVYRCSSHALLTYGRVQHRVQFRSYPSSVNSTENFTVLSHRSSVVLLGFSSSPPPPPSREDSLLGVSARRKVGRLVVLVALAITRLHRRCRGPSSACHAPACPSSTCAPAAVRLVSQVSLRSFILSFRSSLSLFLSVSAGSLWALSLSLAETRSVRSPRPH